MEVRILIPPCYFVAQINRLAVVVRLGFEPELQEIGQSKFESYMPLKNQSLNWGGIFNPEIGAANPETAGCKAPNLLAELPDLGLSRPSCGRKYRIFREIFGTVKIAE